MNEGLEQSISYSLASTLIINNSDDVTLIINSLYPITKRLEQALKLRAIITYKSMFKNNDLPINFNVNSIKTEINFKNKSFSFLFPVDFPKASLYNDGILERKDRHLPARQGTTEDYE